MTMNTEQTDRQSYLYNLKLNIFKIKLSNKFYCVQADETIKPKMLSKIITLFTK